MDVLITVRRRGQDGTMNQAGEIVELGKYYGTVWSQPSDIFTFLVVRNVPITEEQLEDVKQKLMAIMYVNWPVDRTIVRNRKWRFLRENVTDPAWLASLTSGGFIDFDWTDLKTIFGQRVLGADKTQDTYNLLVEGDIA